MIMWCLNWMFHHLQRLSGKRMNKGIGCSGILSLITANFILLAMSPSLTKVKCKLWGHFHKHGDWRGFNNIGKHHFLMTIYVINYLYSVVPLSTGSCIRNNCRVQSTSYLFWAIKLDALNWGLLNIASLFEAWWPFPEQWYCLLGGQPLLVCNSSNPM